MDHSDGSSYASRPVPSAEAAPVRPQRRGRKRKHAADGTVVETENAQPSAKRFSTARSLRTTEDGDGASTSSFTASASSAATPATATSSTATAIGLSMPSISSSGGSSMGGHSQPAAAHSDSTSDTQSSSDCYSNAIEFDLYQLVSPASVSSTVLSPACYDGNAAAAASSSTVTTSITSASAGGISDDVVATGSHQSHLHHVHHHQQQQQQHHPSWLPKGDTTPHATRKADPLAEICADKSSNAVKTAGGGAGGMVESCYWTPSYKQRSCPMPVLSWADSGEMWTQMCIKDDIGWIARDPNLFNEHPGLQPRMRAILLDWLNEVCEVYKMYRETYYLAVDYIDRYLSSKKGLAKTHLQLLGVTALFIAAKVEEIYPPKLRDFAYVTDGACTEEDILQEELLLLCELDWNINPLTVIGWLGMYMQIDVTTRDPDSAPRQMRTTTAPSKLPSKLVTDENVDLQSATTATTAAINTGVITGTAAEASPRARKPTEKTSATGATKTKTDDAFVYPQFSAMEYAHTAQLIDLCSLDVGMANFKYSVIAAAAISHTFDGKTATLVSGLHWEEIAPCAKWMEPFFQVICEENATYPLTFLEQNDQIKTSHGLQLISPNRLTDLYYNKQTHTTSLDMLDMVSIKIEQLESMERMVQLEASPAPLGTIESESGILTPPSSNRKSLEMVLIAAGNVDGGGSGVGASTGPTGTVGMASSCDATQQHLPAHHTHEAPQLQPLPGHGVIIKKIGIK